MQRQPFSIPPLRRHLFTSLYLLAIILFFSSIIRAYRPDTGWTSLILFGDRSESRALTQLQQTPHYLYPQSLGYDGQFYAQIALEPLLQNPELLRAIDSPSTRPRRILVPALAHILGGGDPFMTLQWYASSNLLCWFGIAYLLLHWLPPISWRNAFTWCAILFSFGMIFSIRRALTDAPAALLILVSLRYLNHPIASPLAVGFAALCRETSILSGIAFLNRFSFHSGEWKRLIFKGLIVALPLALWMIYLRSVFGRWGAEEASFTWPLKELYAKFHEIANALVTHGKATGYRWTALDFISLLTQIVFLIRYRDWENPIWRVSAIFLIFPLAADFPIWEGESMALMRVTLPMTIGFNLLAAHPQRSWGWLVWGNLTVLHGLECLRVPVFRKILGYSFTFF